jgi:two-component system, NarL family, nitrate/nitrite response regulator NarL
MDANKSKSLLIIDDHPVYRDALREKLSSEFSKEGIEVSVASNANEGLSLLGQSHQNWVVLLDVLMPGLSGLAGIKVFKNIPNVEHVVSISGLDVNAWEPKTASAGSSLFLSKDSTADFIILKLRPLLAIDPSYVGAKESLEPKEFRLTQRQLEVLDLIAQGHPNKIIADYLDISEQTVKIHINQIFKELRVFNRTQAMIKAQKHCLLLEARSS